MITEKSTYNEIREWFIDNKDSFPDRLDADDRYYYDVRFTAEKWIDYIDGIISKNGKPDDHAKECKRKLYRLYLDLQVKENYNVEFPKYIEDDGSKTKAV